MGWLNHLGHWSQNILIGFDSTNTTCRPIIRREETYNMSSYTSRVNLNNLIAAVVKTKYFVWSLCYPPPLQKNLIKGEHQHVRHLSGSRGDTQNYWGFGLFPSSGILGNRGHDVSETGSVSVFGWEDTYSVGPLRKTTGPVIDISSF
jgi:hypothetical protein